MISLTPHIELGEKDRYTYVMMIDGKQIADELLQKCTNEIVQLKQRGITPTMAVILVGDDPGSASYVRQKEKAAEKIGAKLLVSCQPSAVSYQTIQNLIATYNTDPHIHGVIVQLPLPPHFDISIHRSVDPKKDIDGFVPNSKYQVPVARAVKKILQHIYIFQMPNDLSLPQWDTETVKQCAMWLNKQRIVVIGRGVTAGKPIAAYLKAQRCHVSVIHSHTPTQEKQQVLKTADIIVSCVGKARIVQKDDIQKGVILISVGIWRDHEGKLHGDYEEDEIRDIASFYTPTPGGVGPINVACLMENLIASASPSASLHLFSS